MHPTPTPVSFAAADGYELHGLLFSASAEAKATIQINSGTGIPKEFYRKLASYLCAAGYQVLVYDYRGIGGSRQGSLKGFETTLIDWARLDMAAATDYLRRSAHDLPLLLIGHSLGGQLCGLMPNHQQITAAIFLNSSFGSWRLMPAPYKYVTAMIWYGLVPFSKAFFGYLPAKPLGLGEDLPLGVAEQWARWCKRNDYFVPFLQEPDFEPHYFQDISYPIWSVIAQDDPIANPLTTPPLLDLYTGAPMQRDTISPQEVKQQKIGHLGFMRSAAATYLWPRLLHWLDNQLPA